MAKGPRRLVLGFLLLPLLCAAILRPNIAPLRLWKLQLSHWSNNLILIGRSGSANTEDVEFTRFLLRRLVRGKARRELSQDGISCISDPESDLCVTTDAVRISTATSSSPATVYLTAGQQLPPGFNSFVLRPYPRKTDSFAMQRTAPVHLVAAHSNSPPCDLTHPFPAILFSIGGFAGNFFHDVNDVLIPLFLTAGHLRSRAQLLVADFEPWWTQKYRRVLFHLSSAADLAVASSPSTPVEPKVHCFPAAVVGLKYHGNLLCNSSDAPGGVSTLDFRRFLHSALGLKEDRAAGVERPVLVLISRRTSRALLNEDGVVALAREVGFEVEVAAPTRMTSVGDFAGVVNGCGVLMGVHGAGLTNMVFLPAGAVVVQVVPWGLDWAAAAYYARPARRMGLRYIEYHTAVEESTLYDKYPKDHLVLVDPWSINRQGYNVSRPIYTDGQNLTLDLARFRETLLQALEMLPRPTRLC
ncbi:alpha-1,3-arabinosyltransferase XAT3-like [Elaeis guineensis]|uniref:Alpha-1,3-arabinosyltransferase XAT3-like n=1 Tax=Elaeis guineensis var. tenera TaxID=51953 RepID=A0A8N4EXV8_ELAGV|nr:alpha-1,3-arabinosyltransferase XAT3-like [Elaeis guineensis]